MNFSINKQDLLKSMDMAARACGGRTQKSILECLLIEAEEGRILFTGTDIVTAIRTTVEADVSEPGRAAVPARLLLEMIGKMPDGEIRFSERQGLTVSAGESEFHLQEMDAAQFPPFPEMEGETFAIRQSALKSLIAGTSFAVYQGEDKPIFTGLLMEIEEGSVSMVGIDGVRLAKRKADAVLSHKSNKAVIPSKALKDLARILGDTEDTIDVNFSQSACRFSIPGFEMYTHLLAGEYMNYNNILPKSYKTRILVETGHLLKSLEMVSVLAREDASNLVRFEVKAGYVELASNSEYGAAMDKIPVMLEGDVLKIAFNVKFLIDAFRNIEDDTVYMEFDSRLKPCLIRPLEGEKFLYMVVPVNVNYGDDA